jgi:hypothetical protein
MEEIGGYDGMCEREEAKLDGSWCNMMDTEVSHHSLST